MRLALPSLSELHSLSPAAASYGCLYIAAHDQLPSSYTCSHIKMGQTEDSSEKPREDNLQCRVHSEFRVNVSEATGKKTLNPLLTYIPCF